MNEGKTLAEIAKERKLTLGTIADHAAKLASSGQITPDLLEERIPARLRGALDTIYKAFDEKGTEKLTPVHGHLKAKYSFDELKLARVLYAAEG